MAEGLRKGFTTGSCAAAAAKAACWMLLAGCARDSISIVTPKGDVYDAEILNIEKHDDTVKCAVRKDGGDDPDVTSGALIEAEVRLIRQSCENDPDETDRVLIDGGAGVGRVTKPGLDQPVGMAAINSVPREMIRREVTEVMDMFDFTGTVSVTISVPGGEEIAQHTFNPRLGIEGGISIIGTSGIVEPMSKQADAGTPVF